MPNDNQTTSDQPLRDAACSPSYYAGMTCHCGAYNENECGCPDVDWTPSEVYALRAEIERLNAELKEMTARAVSLAMHLPPETLAGDVQRWRDEFKLLLENDEHVHHYQRGRAWITGLGLWLRKIIETERLVVVARCGLFSGLF